SSSFSSSWLSPPPSGGLLPGFNTKEPRPRSDLPAVASATSTGPSTLRIVSAAQRRELLLLGVPPGLGPGSGYPLQSPRAQRRPAGISAAIPHAPLPPPPLGRGRSGHSGEGFASSAATSPASGSPNRSRPPVPGARGARPPRPPAPPLLPTSPLSRSPPGQRALAPPSSSAPRVGRVSGAPSPLSRRPLRGEPAAQPGQGDGGRLPGNFVRVRRRERDGGRDGTRGVEAMSRQIQLSVGSRDDSQGKTEIRVVRPDRLEFEVSRAVYRLDLVRESVAPYGDYDDLTRPAAAARFLWRNVLYREPREVMAVVFLNIQHRAICHMVAFHGTLSRTAAE